MIEKHIALENVDPVTFYGTGNANMQLLKALFPKVRIVARGNIIKIMGQEEEIDNLEKLISKLEQHCSTYNSLKEEDIVDLFNGGGTRQDNPALDNVIVFGVSGRPVVARSDNQRRLVEDYAKNDMLFAVGPAGSGKTYTAIALAVRALKNKEVSGSRRKTGFSAR